MSFLSTLEHDLLIVGKALMKVEPYAVDAVSTFNPGLGIVIRGLSGKVQAAIVNAEKALPDQGKGGDRFSLVVEDLQSALALAQSITGNAFEYDDGKFKEAVDASVNAHNKMAAFVATVKVKK